MRSRVTWLMGNKDHLGGALMTLIGLAVVVRGRHYSIGTLEHMGPGFFPVSVGASLALVGVLIVISARASVPARPADVPFDWRGPSCIIGGILAFMILGAHGGLVPATFAIVFISALGDRSNGMKQAFYLAGAMVIVAAVVFRGALQMQLPLFTWH